MTRSLFDDIKKYENGSVQSTHGMDYDALESLDHLMRDGLVTGIKSGKGYVNLKLTQKGKDFLALGDLRLSDIKKAQPWHQTGLGALAIAIVGGVVVAYLVSLFGWQGSSQ